jgi:hypothetical protein
MIRQKEDTKEKLEKESNKEMTERLNEWRKEWMKEPNKERNKKDNLNFLSHAKKCLTYFMKKKSFSYLKCNLVKITLLKRNKNENYWSKQFTFSL